MNELDRILAEVESPEPRPGFSKQVMSAIHHELELGRRDAVPWSVILLALLTASLSLPLLLTDGGFLEVAREVARSPTSLWALGLLTVTAIAAVLPQQLIDC